MSVASSALALALAAASPGTRDVKAPPAAGSVAAAPGTAPKVATPGAPEDDDTEDDAAGKKDSEELEAMRALEEVTLDPSAKPRAQTLQSVQRLGLGNPLRSRMEDTLEDGDSTEDAVAAEIPRITDILGFDVAGVAHEYDIPVEMQPLVAQYIEFFQGPGRKWFRKWMGRSTRFIPMMQPILAQYGVPRDLVYLSMIESGFSTQALSWAKASGPWQFIPATGKSYGLHQDFWVDERRDPVKATHAAARFLKRLERDLGGWYLAWAGYNAGGERVRKVVAKKETQDFWQLSDGKGFAKETKHYVPKLIACALVAKHPRAFGFSDSEFEFEAPSAWDEVKLVDPTDLEVIARAAGVDVALVKELNPELRRWCTPPTTDDKPYVLRLPQGGGARFAENFPKIAPRERLSFRVHHIRRGDTLSAIARQYRSAPEAILAINRLKNARTLKVNSDLVIPVAPGHGGETSGSGALTAVLEHQAVKARKGGYLAAKPEDEVPAGTPRGPLVSGPIARDTVEGKPHLTYGVASGDTLWSLSQRFDCSLGSLQSWNHLSHKGKGLQIGTRLSIFPGPHPASVEERAGTLVATKSAEPASAVPAVVSEPTPRTHLLAAGETLWGVAQRYGVSVEDLKKWNSIRKDRAIRAGQALTLVSP